MASLVRESGRFGSLGWLLAALFVLAITLPSLVGCGASAQAREAAERPNVVVVLTDDLDKRLLASHLSDYPNIRALAANGTTFSNAFVTNSLCCPSRATMLTGRYRVGQHRLLVPPKRLAYEEDIRVPLIVRGPGVPRGVTRFGMVLNNDLAPTIARWTSANPLLPVDGRSLAPMLRPSPPSAWRTALLVEGAAHERIGRPAYRAVRTQNYLYVSYANRERELYNLERDPYELRSFYPRGGRRPQGPPAGTALLPGPLRGGGVPVRGGSIALLGDPVAQGHLHVLEGEGFSGVRKIPWRPFTSCSGCRRGNEGPEIA